VRAANGASPADCGNASKFRLSSLGGEEGYLGHTRAQ
jgi:hypothetical protein